MTNSILLGIASFPLFMGMFALGYCRGRIDGRRELAEGQKP